jgi:hypothetical protein
MEHRVHRYAKTFRQKLMDLTKMLSDLRTERSSIDQAILMPERMGAGQGRKRGRPPVWITTLKRRARPPGSNNKSKP